MDNSNDDSMPSTASVDYTPDLRLELRAMMEANRALSQVRIAREAGISAASLSQWLSGTYAGDNAAVEAKVLRWFDSEQAKRASAGAMPAAPDYIETPSTLRIIAALRYAQVAGDIAVIYGGAGMSKTTSIRQFERMAPNVWHATITPASAGVVMALEEVADAVSAGGAVGSAARLHRAVCKRVTGTGGLLVIDEAQHLTVAALDQVRGIHDATGIGIALVGNEQVYARMTGGNRAAYLDRLFSRIGKRVRLVRPASEDVKALADAWNAGEECRPALMGIASKPGALRGVSKTLRLAAMHAAAEGRTINGADVKAAWRELGGAE
jgi:DNA transposition AAA+ family ATPase